MAQIAADKTVDLLKNLSLDPQSKTLEMPAKKPSGDTTITGSGLNQPLSRSVTPLIPDLMDPSVTYFPNSYASSPYYYGGYNGTANEWDDYSRYSYGYAPYGPYSPAGSPMPTVGQDGQLYGGQQFQYPNPYFQPMNPTSGPYSSAAVPPKGQNTPSAAVDSTNAVKGINGSGSVRPNPYQNSIFNANGSYRRGADGVPWLDAPLLSNGQARNNSNITPGANGNGFASRNQSYYPNSHIMSARPMSGVSTTSGYMNQMYPNKLYNQYRNNYRSGYGYGANVYDSQINGRGWLSSTDNKYKPLGRVNGFFFYNNENGDGLNELNRGPRTRSVNQKVLTPITLAVKDQNVTVVPPEGVEKKPEVIEKLDLTPNREQYNQPEFPDSYEDAKFFVIKSYSEDDVHKSIKYNVWASTQNGNKKLDSAYQEAQQKSGSCPVFLFFSVNTSGQFVGVAEMVGPVDFNKSLEYWQQDKWIGCFPVKWHIVKDLPNSLLKHITLENNENKPVTNSRDTQEVKLEQGLQVLKIFKEETSKQCILDDFDFYEDRQQRIQEKKVKQQQFQKQILAPKLYEVSQETFKEATSIQIINGDVNPKDSC
ncbi:YTH domain-containing protein ECT2-like [Bidens hawaiensis]|uniref:YTH domain-containing protein ECT2-like n=1 Tax=Bidens hawaiensis TaxID=980011 RepID=UPI00404A4F43